MSRPTHLTNIKVILVAAILLVAGAGVDLVAHHQTIDQTVKPVHVAPTTQLSYHGQTGKTALALLKQHAKVTTKNSSLGEYVTAINGNNGGGKKYWTFYIDGQESQVGAGAYTTKDSDLISWKLQ